MKSYHKMNKRIIRCFLIGAGSAFVDYALFLALFYISNLIWFSVFFSRPVSISLNYILLHRYGFYSDKKHHLAFLKYILLALASMLASYFSIDGLHNYLGFGIVFSKIISDLLIFFINYLVQRKFIF